MTTTQQIVAATPEAYRLLHDGALALARVERNGMRVDVERLNWTDAAVATKAETLEAGLREHKVYKTMQRRYGPDVKLASREKIAAVLFEDLGLPYDEERWGRTPTGRYRADDEVLSKAGGDFGRDFLLAAALQKIRKPYLDNIRRELVGDLVHPTINVHTVTTYRSSEDSPNLQNVINRIPWAAEMIRSCFIPRDGNILVELDFAAHEFRIAALVWNDPDMLAYATDPDKDIHRDTAARAYCLPRDWVDKDARYCGKNGVVFPRLYGSDYIKISRNLWDMIDDKGLTVPARSRTGVETRAPLRTWLAHKGITRLGSLDRDRGAQPGTFEAHIAAMQDWFDGMFPTWRTAKEGAWQQYLQDGWFRLITGFVCRGVYSRNQFYNYRVQGPAFHCLLWSLIRILAELERRKMRSLIVNQIHDCILGDVPRNERDEFIDLASRIMAEEICRAWAWVRVPLGVEVEIAENNWYQKVKVSHD